MTASTNFAYWLQAFFTNRLFQQRGASAHTIGGYRDAFRLLLRFVARKLRKQPSNLALEDFSAPLVGEFLTHLEKERHNSVRTRNARLAAIHSFFRYVSFGEPPHAERCQQILAIPRKRHERREIAYLTRDEICAVLKAPNVTTWIGRRDRTLLLLAIQTGLRLSEIIGLRRRDVALQTGPYVRCEGKGRKQRCTPLCHNTVMAMKRWLAERPSEPETLVFPSNRSGPLSRDAVALLVGRHCKTAQKECPSLRQKTITPHTLRHTAAMELLHHGVDRSVIALWLGHESVETTQLYLHADMSLKEKALARVGSPNFNMRRYRPPDKLLAFLEAL